MSKVNAYQCNFCGKIETEDKIVGISPIQDLFDELKSYPIVKNLEKTNVHGCTDCYNYCMLQANSINRKKYEQIYIKERQTAGYNFRKQSVYNSINKTFTPPKILQAEKQFH